MAEWKKRLNIDNILKSPEQSATTSVLAAIGKVYEGKGRLYLEDYDTAEPTENGEDGYIPYTFDEEKEFRL